MFDAVREGELTVANSPNVAPYGLVLGDVDVVFRDMLDEFFSGRKSFLYGHCGGLKKCKSFQHRVCIHWTGVQIGIHFLSSHP